MRKIQGSIVAAACVFGFNTHGAEYSLTPFTSFEKHGDHVFDVSLPQSALDRETVLLEVELGCAEVGCSDWDYTVRFEWQTQDGRVELGRLITPYAGFMQRGMFGFDRNWRRKYQLDVSHLTPILKGEGQLVAHYGGWGAKTSAFGFSAKLIAKGATPAKEAKRVIPLYRSGSEGWAYKTHEQFSEKLAPQSIALNDDEVSAEVKVIVSGHGHALSTDNPDNRPELCGEWCDRYFELFNGDEKVVRQQLWRDDCDQSATFPQAGTYLFSRANWCPGEIVEPFSYPVTLSQDVVELDIDWQKYTWQPSPWGNTAPRYIVSAMLVTYGPVSRVTDLAVTQVLSPNKDLDIRNNLSCGLTEVEVSNHGQTEISEIDFDYGIEGGNRLKHYWQGVLAPGSSQVIRLPGGNWGLFDVDEARFSVSASVLGDEDISNNQSVNAIEAPMALVKDSALLLTLDKAPLDTLIEVRDRQGKVVKTWQDLAEAQQHNLPLDLPKGCYTLAIHDSGRDGLYNHFTRSRQGRGAAALQSGDKTIALEPDFGRLLKVPFTVDYALGQCKESQWQRDRAYAVAGEQVSYKGIVYQARHWSYNFEPDKSGPWDAWEALMYCDGTDIK